MPEPDQPKYVSPCKQRRGRSAGSGKPLDLYRPFGAAVELWRCTDAEVLIEGPRGTGKTLAVLHKVNALCFRYPGIRVLLVRATRESMSESVLSDFEEHVLKDHPDYPEFRNTSRSRRGIYKYPNGSRIVIRGMDDMNNLRSTNFDVVVAFEATELTEHEWQTINGSKRNYKMPFQQAIADCNPDRPTHWLNARANRPYEVPPELKGLMPEPRPGQTQMTRLFSRHKDNPKLYDHEKGIFRERGASYLAVLAANTGAMYERHYLGRWAASEGLVYGDFRPEIHVLKYNSPEFPFAAIPRDWRRIRSIDFGVTNACVCQWWGLDGDGRMYLYREIYRSEMSPTDFAKRINELSEGEKYDATISDHQRGERSVLHGAGIRTQPAAKKDLMIPGIDAVTQRLRNAADGKPRLFLMIGSCLDRQRELVESGKPASTLEEFDGYVWEPPKDGKPAKEKPKDGNDHGMDAMRYAVSDVDQIARKRFKLRGGRVGKMQAA